MIAVNVSSLAGVTTAYERSEKDQIIDLKLQIAAEKGLPSSRIKLLKDFEAQKNDVALEALATDGTVDLQTMSEYERVSAGAVESLTNKAADTWDAAIIDVVYKLQEANVEQGQVLWIDLHNESPRSKPAVCAYFSREILGSGPVQIDYRGRAGRSWEELYAWADELSVGKEVISISGASCRLSDGNNKYLCVFWYTREVCPSVTVEHVSSPGNTWHNAATNLLLKLQDKGVQRGQLLGIDGHNDGPYDAAVFTAHFSSSLEGYGRLALDFHIFANEELTRWSTIHKRIADGSAGKELVSLTSSSNENRVVGFAFWHVPIDPLEFCIVETPAGNWNAAAEAMAAKFSELQVQRSQIVTIDAHNRGFHQTCVISAHYRKVASTNDCPLQLAWELQERKDSNWQQLRDWANTVSVGKEVLAITATSGTLADNTSGLSMMVFHHSPAQAPLPDTTPVEFVASSRASGGSWNEAANALLEKVKQANIERGQIISISACNINPDAAAEFQCHFCRARAGTIESGGYGSGQSGQSGQKGKLAYGSFNFNASYNAMHHQWGC